ncbi:elongation factor G-like protein EF-G2 [Microlunatus ginsengisoli]|uniref:Elongation factor G-like protein EF-G2 n=1 Tax=Microlunatus ginsengisoli TaxID=363863 RepID=A0ABP7ABE4_9ACTN
MATEAHERTNSSDTLRNVVLVGPSGAGKTMLFEQLLAARVPGRHFRGDPAATQSLGAGSAVSGAVTVNLLDTPGQPDFVGEVRAGLRAADAVLFVISAAGDIDDATRLLWRECEVNGKPRAVAVTKLEQARADFDETVERCRRAFGDAQPVALPLLADGTMVGLLDLLRQAVNLAGDPTPRPPDAEEGELIEERRAELMESIIEESEDEELLERHLNGEEIPFDTVWQDLRTAVATARFFPIIPTHAPGGIGLEALYLLFEQGFPAPTAAALPAVMTPDGGDFGELRCDPGGPLVAEVVRTTSEPYVGRLSLVRVFSGTLTPDTLLHVCGHLQQFAFHHTDAHADHDVDDERVGPLSTPIGDDAKATPYAVAGDLVLVSKLGAAETSDTLSTADRPALIEPWLLPEPLLPVAIHAASRAEEERLGSALQRLVAEDVTMRLEHNPETHQIVLWAMGPAHVDKLLSSLRDTWHVQVEVEPLRTSLRETFVRPVEVLGRLVKQSGGHGQYAICKLEIEPLDRGAGVEFAERVVGGAVPRQYIPSVEKGARNQLEKGVLAGYPVVDVRVTLVDGKAHSVDSSDMAFQTAAMLALREAANESNVSLLEPIDTVEITVAEDSLGSVLADLRGRRGFVHGTEAGEIPGQVTVHAEVPAHELARYPIDLRSVSHGTGTFTRTFARYDYMPPALARTLAAT